MRKMLALLAVGGLTFAACEDSDDAEPTLNAYERGWLAGRNDWPYDPDNTPLRLDQVNLGLAGVGKWEACIDGHHIIADTRAGLLAVAYDRPQCQEDDS